MRFAFTTDQLALRDAVREMLVKECPSSEVRSAWSNANGRTAGTWDALMGMGVLEALVPEAAGGLGLSVLDLVLVCEEVGRVALPEPFVEHALVAAAVVGSGHGSMSALVGPAALSVYADSVDAVLVEDDERLLLVAREGLVLERQSSVDHTRHLFTVDWSNTEATTEVGGPRECADAFDRAALGNAATLLGLAQNLLDVTVDYTATRSQFGAPIGSFQAVKHKLADVRIALEFARPLIYRAAYSLSVDDIDRSIHVSMCAAQVADAASLAVRHALQCHGAIGYSDESDLHMWMKRVWALQRAYGDPAWHRERVARAILDKT
ncbi:MAG: acyl-CoA dehydrogenase [Acidimicrobiia bacterium]|nr:acyl-CoA dehydrogenase [Acidimicrobiia bacterium]